MVLDDIRQAHLDEPCPHCKAASGERCVSPKGVKISKPHADRIHNGNILFQERMQAVATEAEATKEFDFADGLRLIIERVQVSNRVSADGIISALEQELQKLKEAKGE